MRIRITNKSYFLKHNKFMYSKFTNEFQVFAILNRKNKIEYLVLDDDVVSIYDSKHFEIIDDKIPDFWVFKKFQNNTIENKKYNFSFRLDTYVGPRELIENQDFLFDIYENLDDALSFLYITLKKYNSEWRTPPQT